MFLGPFRQCRRDVNDDNDAGADDIDVGAGVRLPD